MPDIDFLTITVATDTEAKFELVALSAIDSVPTVYAQPVVEKLQKEIMCGRGPTVGEDLLKTSYTCPESLKIQKLSAKKTFNLRYSSTNITSKGDHKLLI